MIFVLAFILKYQGIASEEDTDLMVSPVEEDDSYGPLDTDPSQETILPQPTSTEIEVKGFINKIRTQNDLKPFSAELGITDVHQQESSLSDDLLHQVRMDAYTCIKKVCNSI